MKKLIFTILSVVVLLCCNRVEGPAPSVGEEVSATLDVDVVQMDLSMIDGDVATKGVYDPATIASTEDVIKNLWVIQFDGTDENSALLGDPTYVADFSQFSGNVNFVSTDTPCSIFLIANTFENGSVFTIPQGYTISDLRTRLRSVSSQNDIMGLESDGETYHPIFNCEIEASDGVHEGDHFTAQLRRNIAKVNITLINNTIGSGAVTIESMQLRSIPNVSYYVANGIDNVAPFPVIASENYIDYEEIPWSAGVQNTITAYLPANMRGTVVANTSQSSKNRYAPQGATNLYVKGSYKNESGDVIPLTYTFFLGGNMTDDFNLKNNFSYNYTFTINGKGDADKDTRIYDWGMVDFSDAKYPLANCYILNPIPQGTTQRIFRIPIQRIMTFWGKEGRALYENDEYLSLRQNGGKWRAWVLASDFAIDPAKFSLTKYSGNRDADRYFEVAVSPGVEGNVIVAVGPDDGSNSVSWSWHLWITDYDPTESLYWEGSEDGRYIYPVKNGSMHRYEGAYWNTHKSTYIMDRNLGWRSDPYQYPADNIGLVYYQFGRKDPFFFSSSIYIYPTSGAVHTFKIVEKSVANADNGMLYSVKNPMHFVKGPLISDNSYEAWNNGNKYNPDKCDKNQLWQDPTTVYGKQNEGMKSIFDPCPPGYRLPNKESWTDFRLHSESNRSTNSYYNDFLPSTSLFTSDMYYNGFKPFNDIKGGQYWPFPGEGILIPDKVVYYPAAGFLQSSGIIAHHGNRVTDYKPGSSNEKWVFLWAEDIFDNILGYSYTAQHDHLEVHNTISQSRAFPVRCITER